MSGEELARRSAKETLELWHSGNRADVESRKICQMFAEVLTGSPVLPCTCYCWITTCVQSKAQRL